MKKSLGIILCLVPLTAYAQQTYTNEDLKRFSVPGAYTNQDLKKLPPLPVVGKAGPAAPAVTAPEAPPDPLQIRFDLLSEQKRIYQAELDWRQAMVDKAYSFVDQGPDGYPWPGYRSKSKSAIQYLEMQIAVVESRIETVRDEARQAGVLLDEL
jgi:hypothetical protein